jgi:hypothetical protein
MLLSSFWGKQQTATQSRPPRVRASMLATPPVPSLRPRASVGAAGQRHAWLSASGVPCAPEGDLFPEGGRITSPDRTRPADGRHPPPVSALPSPAGAPRRVARRQEQVVIRYSLAVGGGRSHTSPAGARHCPVTRTSRIGLSARRGAAFGPCEVRRPGVAPTV